MNSDSERRTSKAILSRDLDDLREALNLQQSEFKEQLAQFQSAHRYLCDTYKALECNFKNHLAQSQLAQSQNEAKLAKLAVKLKNYKIEAFQGRLLAKNTKKIQHNNKSSSSDESVDSDEDGAANISFVAATTGTDGMSGSVQTPVVPRVSKEARVYTCAICLKEYKTKPYFERHQRTAHVQQNEDKTMDVSIASASSNLPAAKKRKIVVQKTDTTDAEKPINTKTTSEDRTDQSLKLNTSSTNHSPSRTVEVQEIAQIDQISENALIHPTWDSFLAPANSDHNRFQERTRNFSARPCHSREDESTSFQTFPCPVCQETFPSLTNLQIHKELHLNEVMVGPITSHWNDQNAEHDRSIGAETNNQCQEETFTSNGREDADYLQPNHLDEEQVERRHPHVCEQCQEKFQWGRCLRQHIMKEHGFVDNFCNRCCKYYPSASSLKKHLIVHPGCGLCPNTFSDIKQLCHHYKRAHEKLKLQIVCTVCQGSYENKQTWLKHRRTGKCWRSEGTGTEAPASFRLYTEDMIKTIIAKKH